MPLRVLGLCSIFEQPIVVMKSLPAHIGYAYQWWINEILVLCRCRCWDRQLTSNTFMLGGGDGFTIADHAKV
jgi:hypothetical protein